MRKRDLSRRERQVIEDAIDKVCRTMRVSPDDPEYRQSAWEAILSVYQDDRAGFFSPSRRAWRRAYTLAWEAIDREQQWRWQFFTAIFRLTSRYVKTARRWPIFSIRKSGKTPEPA